MSRLTIGEERVGYFKQLRCLDRDAQLFLLHISLTFIGEGLFALLYNFYLLELGYRENFIGAFASTQTLAAGFGALPAVLLTDHLGRRWALLLGAMLRVVAFCGQSFMVNSFPLLFFALVRGFSLALYWIPRGPFLVEHSAMPERVHLFSAAFLAELIPELLANLLGGRLPGYLMRVLSTPHALELLAYRYTLLIGAFCAVVGAIPLVLLGGDERRPVIAQGSEPRRASWRVIALLALVELTGSVGSWMVAPFFNVYFAAERGATSRQVGDIFFVGSILTIVSVVFSPFLVRRLGPLRAIAISRVTAMLPTVFLPASPGLLWAAAMYWARNVAFFAGVPAYGSFSMEAVAPEFRATTSGVRHAIRNLSRSIGSFLAGQMIVTLGYRPVFYLAGALTFVSGIIVYGSFG